MQTGKRSARIALAWKQPFLFARWNTNDNFHPNIFGLNMGALFAIMVDKEEDP